MTKANELLNILERSNDPAQESKKLLSMLKDALAVWDKLPDDQDPSPKEQKDIINTIKKAPQPEALEFIIPRHLKGLHKGDLLINLDKFKKDVEDHLDNGGKDSH